MTLDEQITGLEGIPTDSAEQFAAKSQVLNTLRTLKAMRAQFETGNPNEGKVIKMLLTVLGEHPQQRRA